MRTLIVTAVLVGLAVPAQALYAPNPAGRWAADRFFLAADFRFDSEKDLDKPRGEVEDVTGFFVRPAYSIAPNAMIYGRLGFQDSDGLDSGLALGFGAQAAWVLPRAPRWAIGGAFDFLYWQTEVGRSGRDLDWTELQFSPAVSYHLPDVPGLTPYAGFALDFVTGDADEDDPFGLFIGTNFDLGDRIRFDGQFRAINETGIFLSAGYLF